MASEAGTLAVTRHHGPPEPLLGPEAGAERPVLSCVVEALRPGLGRNMIEL
jgi:hypothetical protein